MSSIDVAAAVVKRLSPEEWQVLRAAERCSMGNRPVDERAIARQSGQPVDRVVFALDRLSREGLTGKKGSSYSVYGAGLDALALKFYVDHESVSSLGKIIAKGKESDVYEVLTDGGKLFALKLFRLGRTSFRDVRRKRARSTRESFGWASENYSAAKREFAALKRLEGVSEHIPGAISHNRHTVLLEEVLGVRLAERPELADAGAMLGEILATLRKLYLDAGVINADLSEYNILTDGERFWFIDWPQAIGPTHPNAKERLSRDANAVVVFFRKAYGLMVEPADVLAYILGAGRKPKVRRV